LANVTQGSGTTSAGRGLNESWRLNYAYAVNNQRGVLQRITDTKEEHFGGGWKIHWPIMPAWASATYGGSISFTDANITESVATPTIGVSAALIQDDVIKTMPVPAVKAYSPALAEAVLQKIETDILGLHASSTSTSGSSTSTFSEGDYLTAIGNLATNAGDKFAPGEWFGIYHIGQYKNALSYGNLVSASVRGETNGPSKSGMLKLAYGGDLMFTGNVVSATGRRNILFVKPWCWIARKDTPSIRMEWSASDLGVKVVASHMYGLAVLITTLATVHITA
jgi:hypothetical protein